MSIGIKISNLKKMSLKKATSTFLQPKFVYIPLISQNDTNITLMVKKGDYVFKGTVIGKRKGNFRIPIHSSVSGTVVGYEEHTHLNGEKIKCVVIENDFKEKYEERKGIKKILNRFTTEQFVEMLKECGIVGMGGSGFPTYIKYSTNKRIKTLIINASECEPFITADCALVKDKCEEILEVIDAIIDIFHIEECFIAVRKDNTKIKKIFNDFIGTYLKIKLVDVSSVYPSGWERNLIEDVKKVSYKKEPIEKGIIVNNVSTMYAIYEALKMEKPLIERIITITGDAIKKPQNILVKNGTLIKDILEEIKGLNSCRSIKFVAGGPMTGISLPSNDLVVTSNLNCVLVLKNPNITKESDCIHCGKCVGVCPAKLSPVIIKDNINKEKILSDLQVNRCIECGLCSYICPSKIDVREYVKKAKENLNKRR